MARRSRVHVVRAGRATGLAAVTACALVGAWTAAGLSGWPASGIEAEGGERLRWVDPTLGPIGVAGDLDTADVLVVGDSRVAHAVHLSIAGGLGVGEFALVWLSSARLEDLLAPLVALEPPRRLVIALAPLGLVRYPQNLAIAETLRAPSAATDPASPPSAVAEWARSERAHLEARGFDPRLAERTVVWWVDNHRLARAGWRGRQRWFDSHGLDTHLGHRVDRARAMWVDPVEPKVWHKGWTNTVDVRASDAAYTRIVDPARADERAAGAARVTALLRELTARGFEVVCVRLPIDPGLRALEETAGSAELLAGIAAAGPWPYRDFGAWEGATFDGSHLNWRAADRLTRELVRWLRADVSW